MIDRVVWTSESCLLEQGHPCPSLNLQTTEVEEKPQKSLNEIQKENPELLIRGILACIIYKCLLQWRTRIFDRIIQTLGNAIETQDNNGILILCLLVMQCFHASLATTAYIELKARGAAGMTPQFCRSSSATLFGFGRMTLVRILFVSTHTLQ
ncbi:hypothetical protein V6N11_071859 [Hibiscus sabdariffa]|uniref:Uncharacterized protein n=1 Tax=Hibiscus sabdariffa TaxID=183260 RepID=A0ABR2U1Y0_9ROSI